ncbi:MAG: ThiF family adenylyltransferase [Lactobacillaceae bacterium]|jgi:adenylyltransferase/sulfurtransferase|nr:ThiF family adenylyltransferase [Lactobacillaceae bacterium]
MEKRIKKTLQPVQIGDKIYFGYGNTAIVRSVDNTKLNNQMIHYLNGEISRQEVNATDEQINSIISDWQNHGALTNNKYDNKEKYSRNINFYEWVDISSNLDPSVYQSKLTSSTVSIIGIGGIGGTSAEILARSGIGKLILVDDDVVDSSNVTRQSVYTELDIGKFKVDVASEYLLKLNPDINIVTKKMHINNKLDLESFFKISNVVIAAADTPFFLIDEWVDENVKKFDVPAIIGSYASTVINSIVLTKKSIPIKTFYNKNAVTNEELLNTKIPHSIIAPVSYMAAGLVTYQTIMLITGLQDFNKSFQLDLLDWSALQYELY